MIRIFLLVVLFAGCANYQALLDRIPYAEFEKFKYSRGGNVSSATVICEGAKIDKEGISIDQVYILESFPFMTISAELTGYHRKFEWVQPKTMKGTVNGR